MSFLFSQDVAGNPKMLRHRGTLLLCLALLVGIFPHPARGEEMIFAVQPYLPAVELKLRYEPLVSYLAEQTNLPLKMRIGRDYDHHIEYIGKGKIDFAFIGPAPYVKLTQLFGKHPIIAQLQSHGNWYYQGKIVVRSGSSLKNITDMKGKRFAFGDPNSTMSTFMPRYMLYKKGIDLADLEKFDHLGSHDNVALGILSGDYDAGALKTEVYNAYAPRGLTAIASTPLIPEHIIIARRGLAQDICNRVQQVLLSLKNTTKGKEILQRIKGNTTEVAKAQDSDYDDLRRIMSVVNELNKN